MSSDPDLFGFVRVDADARDPPPRPHRGRGRAGVEPEVAAVMPRPEWLDLAQRIDRRIRLGTSSWSFPGWRGLVFAGDHRPDRLARQGLAAYAQHPLLRTVSLDRSFYRPLPATEYAELAAQVPDDFRFIVKAWSGITDAMHREAGTGQPLVPNPQFLDAPRAAAEVIQPASEGLQHKLGALVFQLSPIPPGLWRDEAVWLDRLGRFLADVPRPAHGVLALEVRDAGLLTPALAQVLKAHAVRYCLGLHDRLPDVEAQLPMLRALWPGPLVCRWSLGRGLAYVQAKARFAPFDRLQAPDLATRLALARVAAATARAGHEVLIALNNKAEGSAPLSVLALAEALRDS